MAIELAKGDAPNSELHAMKVLMAVLNNPAPSLSTSENWSTDFRTFVNACLQKDPVMRPTAEELLTKPEFQAFLKKAGDSKLIKQNFLVNL